MSRVGKIAFFPNTRYHNRAVYTRENKPWLTLSAGYIIRERNYLYEYKHPGQDKPWLEKAVNVDFVPFIRGGRGIASTVHSFYGFGTAEIPANMILKLGTAEIPAKMILKRSTAIASLVNKIRNVDVIIYGMKPACPAREVWNL